MQEHGILWGGGGNWQSWVDEWDALEELKRKGQDKATLALIGTVQVLLLLVPVCCAHCSPRAGGRRANAPLLLSRVCLGAGAHCRWNSWRNRDPLLHPRRVA